MDDEKDVSTRGEQEILRLAQRKRKVTQAMISEKIGVRGSALSQSMSRPRISLGMFAKILNAMGYDIMIVDRETGEAEWRVFVAERDLQEDDI